MNKKLFTFFVLLATTGKTKCKSGCVNAETFLQLGHTPQESPFNLSPSNRHLWGATQSQWSFRGGLWFQL